MRYKAALSRIVMVALAVVAMAGCMEKDPDFDVARRQTEITFKVKSGVIWKTDTKGMQVTEPEVVCNKYCLNDEQKLVIQATYDDLDFVPGTKATPVSSLASFNVAATTGSAGSESSVWNNVSFSGTTTYTGGKVWPSTDPSYHFYASNASLGFSAAGTTVDVTTTTDVVCAYMQTPTFNDSNTLTFDHVLSRIDAVSASSAVAEVTLSNVSITLVPNVSGTYNMCTGIWSSLVAGSPVELANADGSEKDNDVWLVPGTYTVAVSWKATKGGYEEDFTSWEGSLTVAPGKNVSFNVSLTSNPTIELKTFADMYIAPGNVYYDGSAYQITDSWEDHSYNVAKGVVTGSYLHSFDEMSDAFSTVSAKTGSALDINNGRKISFMDMNWQMMSRSDYDKIFSTGTTYRNGSTVNGSANKHYCIAQLTGYTNGAITNPIVLIVFPDDEVITTSRSMTYMDVATLNTGVTKAQVDEYVAKGCAAFMSNGEWTGGSYAGASTNGYYWLCNSYNVNNGYYIEFNISPVLRNLSVTKNSEWFPVRCISKGIEITSSEATLWRTQTAIYTASESCVWTSSDITVATVDPATGVVTAVGPGEADIIATSGLKSVSNKVYVNRITGISLSTSSLNNSDKSFSGSLTATAVINNGGTVYGSPGTVTINYSSDATSLATVANATRTSGTANTINYVSAGSPTITASVSAASYGDNASASCSVTLTPWMRENSTATEIYLWTTNRSYILPACTTNVAFVCWGGTPTLVYNSTYVSVTLKSDWTFSYNNLTYYYYDIKPALSNFAGQYSLTATLGTSTTSTAIYVNKLSDSIFGWGVDFSNPQFYWDSQNEEYDWLSGTYYTYHGYFSTTRSFYLITYEEPQYRGSATRWVISFPGTATDGDETSGYDIVGYATNWFQYSSSGRYWFMYFDYSNDGHYMGSNDAVFWSYEQGDDMTLTWTYSYYNGSPHTMTETISGSDINFTH